MATAGDGRTSCESGGSGENGHKRILRPEIYEDSQNDSQEAGPNNSSGASDLSTLQGGIFASISDTVGKSELGQTVKQMTFTRSEAKCLIELVHSRIMEESPSHVIRLESSTRGSLKKHEHGDERDNSHAAILSSRVLEEETASPTEVANAYKRSTIGQAPREDSKFSNNNATCLPKPPMASPQHPATLEDLPDELLSNIFVRLLAKQLAQMRSVSKSWNSLLSESSFVKSHLDRSIHNNDQILVFFYDNMSSYPDSKWFTALPCRSTHLALTNFIKLPPLDPKYKGIRVIGSVNGLICSCYGDSVIHIWNPSLSAFLTLPPYSMPSDGYDRIKIFFRFGYDPKTDDYKVVKLTGLIRSRINAFKCWLDVEIYSMRKGSWGLITERFPSHITRIFDDDVVCLDGHDGHLHWLCCIGESMFSDCIVAFNLGTQTFLEMPLPDSVTEDRGLNYLGVLGGKLCVMSRVWDETCQVWVMDEYGVVGSWVKRYVFSWYIGDAWPLGFTSHNEFLRNDYKRRIILYDPVANKKKVFETYSPEELEVDKIVEYVDSLVWVAPAKREMVDDVGQN